jgi:hypothetical protein
VGALLVLGGRRGISRLHRHNLSDPSLVAKSLGGLATEPSTANAHCLLSRNPISHQNVWVYAEDDKLAASVDKVRGLHIQ